MAAIASSLGNCVTHTFLPSFIASGVGMGPRISGARTNGEAVIRISLRDAAIDTGLDQSSLNSAILVTKVSFESSGLFHTSLGSAVEESEERRKR